MGSLILIQAIVAIIVIAIVAVPVVKILHKAGYSGWWAILWFIPIVNIVVIWIFAFAQWPALRDRA